MQQHKHIVQQQTTSTNNHGNNKFWLFQEHAQLRQITPSKAVEEPIWSDAACMPQRRFCSFMAHSNLVPVAFKQRVLQVENVLRQRLSQEQVLWPSAETCFCVIQVSRQNLLKDTFDNLTAITLLL